MSLSTAATRNLDSREWEGMKEGIGRDFQKRLSTSLNISDEQLVKVLCKVFESIDNQSYNWKLERWQYCVMLLALVCRGQISWSNFNTAMEHAQQILLLIDLHRKLVNCAHGSLDQRMMRLKELTWTITLTEKLSEEEDQRLNFFMSDYQEQYRNRQAVHLDKLAEQLLVGWPEVDAGCLQCILTVARILWSVLALCLGYLAAIAPDFVRGKELNFHLHLPEDSWSKVVAIVFLSMMYLHFYVCFIYPRGIMLLFTEMSKAYRIFSIMLTDKAAARALCVPYVRVDVPEDILNWYELYSYFILSTKRRKFSLEFSFAFNLLTVICLSSITTWEIVFFVKSWHPGILFCETIVILVSFLFFSMPPLFMGLRVNMLRRRTVDLLLGHAGEARAYLHYRTKHEINRGEQKTDVESGEDHAIYVAEMIANRLRLDSWLVVRTMGVELTIGQFTAIASLMSTAIAYAVRNADWQNILSRLDTYGL